MKKPQTTSVLPPTTAALRPGFFADELSFAGRRSVVIALLVLFLVLAFSFRVGSLGYESLGEDELNKLETVEEYRANGLSGKNGEHPFLMKGLQTASLFAAEKWNDAAETARVSEEAALRFPLALFGTFTTLLIFLLCSSLFSRTIAIVAAALWAVEPVAIGFDRIAKEDSLVVFFFLLTQIFWVRSQTVAESGQKSWFKWALLSGASFAALMASKYYPHLLAISGGYYNVFKYVPGKLWNLGPRRWLTFFVVMGFTFLVLNPTIMLPDTWREMLKFSSENRIGHDSYEFMGSLYRNQMTAWLSGVPWTFYYVFLAVKTSLPTLLLFLIGIAFVVRRQMGDGRFLLFFWAFMWFLPFTFLGGKFTRYFAFVTPLIFIVAAAGFYFSVKWLSAKLGERAALKPVLEAALLAIFLAVPFFNSLTVAPHFRMFTNSVGGGQAAAGSYFPHDEFYDAATRPAIELIAQRARPGAVVASETPGLYGYYARRSGRHDLQMVSLSDRTAVGRLAVGDLVVLARGRRYVSNTPYYQYLQAEKTPAADLTVAEVPAVKVYEMDGAAAERMHALAR